MPVVVNISPDFPDKIYFESWPVMQKEKIRSIPGHHYVRSKDTFTVPLTWASCIALRTTFENDLVIGNELREWAFDERKNHIEPAIYWRNVVEGPVETELDEKLFPHQRADTRFVESTGKAIILNGLGSGKTFSAIASIKRLHESGKDVLPVIVACPNSTKINWKREIAKLWPEAKTAIISGTATQKKETFKNFSGTDERCLVHDPYSDEEFEKLTAAKKKSALKAQCTCPKDFLIINWEALHSHSSLQHFGSTALKVCTECGGLDPSVSLRSCERHHKELNDIHFKSAIGDELHRIKDASSKQTRAWKRVSEGTTYRIGLTGTPIADTPLDMWSLLNWLDPKSFPGKTIFQDRYLEMSWDVFGYPIISGVKEHMKPEFYSVINPHLRRMPKEIILPLLPPILRETRLVTLNAKQQKAYNQMRDKSIAELDNDTIAIASTNLVRTNRLLQFSSAYGEAETWFETVEDDDGMKKEVMRQKVHLTDPSATLDAFMDDIEGFGGEQVVVFAPHSQIIELLSKRMTKENIPHGKVTGEIKSEEERQFHMDNFAEGRTQFILCTTGAGGVGINLNTARIAVFLYRPYSNIESEQSEGRIHRIGSEKFDNVLYIDYVAKDTVQESVFEILARKKEHAETILQDRDLMKKLIMNEFRGDLTS